METNSKLNEISTGYSKFDANQVLTETQLNAFIDYFDDQDRLSRIGLSGVGLACGFQLTPLFNTDNTTMVNLTISQGTAVTTDGDYVQFFDLIASNIALKKFSYVKKLERDKGDYSRFKDSQENVFDLWELYTTAPDDSYDALTSFTGIQNMSVLLYLEQYSKQDALCNKLSCDSQGIEQINNLKVLLIKTSDLKATLSKDTIYTKNNWQELYNALAHIAIPRDIIKINENSNDSDFIQLKKIYQTVLENGTLKDTIKESLNLILKRTNKTPLSNNFDLLFETTKNNILQDFQYRYNALKDIVATYNEIQELLLNSNFNCCPDISSFPKHIMLGSLNVNTSVNELRHDFYESSILRKSKENWSKLDSLLDRVLLLINNYMLLTSENTIEITPSISIGKLGEKAIPAYYNVSDNLLNNWNFKKTLNLKQKTNLSYHRGNLLQQPTVQTPLLYEIDNFNFFRIEGTHGKNYRTALDEVQKIRDTYGVAFDVKTLKLSVYNNTINLNNYESIFRDLQLSLVLWQKDLNCTLATATTLLSSFSTDDVGGNTTVNTTVNITDTVANVAELPDKTVAGVLSNSTSNAAATSLGYSRVSDLYLSETYLTGNTYLDQMHYYANTTTDVEQSISQEEKTIGSFFTEILSNNTGDLSAEKLKLALEDRIFPIVDTDLWNDSLDVKDIAIAQPIEILAYIYDFSLKVPTTLVDLTEVKVAAFNASLKKICALSDKYKAQYDQSDISDELKKDISILITHLSSICCSGEKLEILVSELSSRKATILSQLQFKEYIKEHPATRHLAGVPEGGTFIMVYLEEDETGQSAYEPSQISFTFLEQPNIDDDGLDGDEGRIELWDKYLSTNFAFVPRYVFGVTQNPIDEVILIGNELPQTVRNFVDFLNKKWSRAGADEYIKATIDSSDEVTVTIEINNQKVDKGANFIYFHNPEIIGVTGKTYFEENKEVPIQIVGGNTVVADFALPYRCCGDGTSIDFIIPKEPISLSLPEAYVCLKEDETITPLTFTATPENATIEAVVPEGTNAGIYVDEITGETKIDVHQVDTSLLGKVIQFTANGASTNCQIIVYPVIDISIINETPIYNNNKSEADVDFTLIWNDQELKNSALANQLIYQWDFLEDGNFVTKTITNNTFSNKYALPINELNKITPKLKVSFGTNICETPITIDEIEFESFTPSELEIETPFCFDIGNETEEVNFTNVNGNITIAEGDINGLEIQDGTLMISAPNFQQFGEEINFLEDEQPTSAQITIYPILNLSVSNSDPIANDNNEAQIIFTIDFDNIGFENLDLLNEIIYKWDFLGEGNFETKTIQDNNTFSFDYTLPSDQNITITPVLRVSFSEDTCEIPITIDDIELEPIRPSELGIETPFCFDLNNEIEEIDFTNVNGDITIDGDDIVGLEIQGNTLVIIGGVFESFGEIIRFLENGQPTSAQITIHEVKQLAIEEIENRYFWQGGRLVYKVDLQPNLPGGTNTSGATYNWQSSDGQSVTTEDFSPEFEFFEPADRTLNITLTITFENGCESTAPVLPINIDYPDFEILPTGLNLCIDDGTPTIITVNPNFEGTQLIGDGIAFNSTSNAWEFIPENTGLTTAEPVTIDLNGSSTSLVINLSSAPTASFTDVFDPETQILALTNTSQRATSFDWTITDESGKDLVFEVDTKGNVELSTQGRDTNSFNVRLNVTNDCGDNTTTRTISVLSCIDATSGIIDADHLLLSKYIIENIREETPTSLINLSDKTDSFYQSIRNRPENSLNGNNNATIFSTEKDALSIPNLFELSRTTAQKLKELGELETLATPFYIAQVKLFFNIIHCQLPEIWEGDFGPTVGDLIKNLAVDSLKENTSFKTFMVDYAKGLDPQDVTINNFVNNLTN